MRLGVDGLTSVVAVGAHPDDIEIGAGGTLLRLAREHPAARFTFLVFTGSDARKVEADASAHALLGERVTLHCLGAVDGSLPYDEPTHAKTWLRSMAPQEPDLVFAPWQEDAHQDHRFAGSIVWQVLRRAPILEYRIPKWETEAFAANVFFPLTEADASAKVAHLLAHFPSQQDKPWYREDTFRASLLTGGTEAACSQAEGFVGRKLVFD